MGWAPVVERTGVEFSSHGNHWGRRKGEFFAPCFQFLSFPNTRRGVAPPTEWKRSVYVNCIPGTNWQAHALWFRGGSDLLEGGFFVQFRRNERGSESAVLLDSF